jgi:hypothetical protein
LVVRPARSPFQGSQQFFRRIKVWKSLGQIDGLVAVGKAGHSANNRFGKVE